MPDEYEEVLSTPPRSRAPRAPGEPSIGSLAIFVDEAVGLFAKCRRPAVLFRLLDYPTLLIKPAGAAPHATPDGVVAFRSGKSCLFEWEADVAPEAPRRVQLMLVDLVQPPRAAEPAGPPPSADAPTSAGGVGMLLARAVLTLDVGTPTGPFTARAVEMVDLVGNAVATLHVRSRLAQLGGTLAPHLLQNLSAHGAPFVYPRAAGAPVRYPPDHPFAAVVAAEAEADTHLLALPELWPPHLSPADAAAAKLAAAPPAPPYARDTAAQTAAARGRRGVEAGVGAGATQAAAKAAAAAAAAAASAAATGSGAAARFGRLSEAWAAAANELEPPPPPAAAAAAAAAAVARRDVRRRGRRRRAARAGGGAGGLRGGGARRRARAARAGALPPAARRRRARLPPAPPPPVAPPCRRRSSSTTPGCRRRR